MSLLKKQSFYMMKFLIWFYSHINIDKRSSNMNAWCTRSKVCSCVSRQCLYVNKNFAFWTLKLYRLSMDGQKWCNKNIICFLKKSYVFNTMWGWEMIEHSGWINRLMQFTIYKWYCQTSKIIWVKMSFKFQFCERLRVV